jgi:hypothetical protein
VAFNQWFSLLLQNQMREPDANVASGARISCGGTELRLAGECRLDRIIHVHLEDGLVDLTALRLDTAEVGDDVLVEDVVDPAKAQGGLKTTGEAAELGGALLAALALDGFERILEAVDGEAQRVRELLVQEKELEDALGREIGGVDLALCLEGGRGTE